MFFEMRLKIDIEISDIFDKHYFETSNFNIDINYNLMIINIHTKNKKIENRRRQIVVENRFVVHDFVYRFDQN